MPIPIRLVALVCLLLTVAPAFAGENDNSAIQQLEAQFIEAGRTNDIPTQEKLYAPEFVLIGPKGKKITRSEWLESLRNDELKVQTLTIDEVDIHTYSDSAVVTGRGQRTATYRGADASYTWRFSHVWIKRAGKWQLVLTQTTKMELPTPSK